MQVSNNITQIQSYLSLLYGGRRLVVVPYAYNLTFLALAQNATASQNLNIAANADFLMLGISCRAQIGAVQTMGALTAPFVRMLITDSGSNEQYSNVAVDLVNYASIGDSQRSLSFPRLVNGRTSLNVALTNYAPAAETYTSIDLMFEGVLVRSLDD